MSRFLEEIKPRGTQVTWDIGTYLSNANRKIVQDVTYASNVHNSKVIDDLISKVRPTL